MSVELSRRFGKIMCNTETMRRIPESDREKVIDWVERDVTFEELPKWIRDLAERAENELLLEEERQKFLLESVKNRTEK